MRRAEIRDTAKMAGTVLGGGVELIEDLHMAIARRSFRTEGSKRGPTQATHTGSPARCTAWLPGCPRRPRLAASVAAAGVPTASPLAATRLGTPPSRLLNGMWGDRLTAARSSLAFEMTVRHGHADLALTAEAVGDAFPSATGQLAVFVHGLCETDDSWRPSQRRQRTTGALDFGQRLAVDAGSTPIYIRYNSGLHVSNNGAALGRLLDALIAVWPVPVRELALVGHSMGGLVVRQARPAGGGPGRTMG